VKNRSEQKGTGPVESTSRESWGATEINTGPKKHNNVTGESNGVYDHGCKQGGSEGGKLRGKTKVYSGTHWGAKQQRCILWKHQLRGGTTGEKGQVKDEMILEPPHQ